MQPTITRVHGFLTSVVSGPIVVPSEWIPMVFGDPDDAGWETTEQAQRAMTLLMRFHNEIASDLSPGGRRYSILIDRIGDGAGALDFADDWCRGYALGIALREDEWKEALEAPELQEAFLPILSTAHPEKPGLDPTENFETYKAHARCTTGLCRRDIRVVAQEACGVHASPRHFRSILATYAAPNASPNASCPCGSGKKYKRRARRLLPSPIRHVRKGHADQLESRLSGDPGTVHSART